MYARWLFVAPDTAFDQLNLVKSACEIGGLYVGWADFPRFWTGTRGLVVFGVAVPVRPLSLLLDM